ncbi:MAG: hypothetical protein R2690_08160 [Acidimicrobiales bacterium]
MADIRTVSDTNGGSSSSRSPCTNSSGVLPSSSACSQPADWVDNVTTPATWRCKAIPARGDGTAEAVPHRDEPLRALAAGEVGGGEHVVGAAVEVVGAPVADAHRGDPVLGPQPLAEVVVDAVRRTEHATHGAAEGQHHVLRVLVTVPEHREQAAHRVQLEVAQVVADTHLLQGDGVEGVERCGVACHAAAPWRAVGTVPAPARSDAIVAVPTAA